jgi:hypothetical protein
VLRSRCQHCPRSVPDCSDGSTLKQRDDDDEQKGQRCRFGNGGIRAVTSAAAGGLAEVGAPSFITLRRTVSLAPDDVVGGVDGAVEILLTGFGHAQHARGELRCVPG